MSLLLALSSVLIFVVSALFVFSQGFVSPVKIEVLVKFLYITSAVWFLSLSLTIVVIHDKVKSILENSEFGTDSLKSSIHKSKFQSFLNKLDGRGR